jgi:hypothetical protein
LFNYDLAEDGEPGIQPADAEAPPDTPSGGSMPDKLHQILSYASRNYHSNLGRQDDLAEAYLAIVEKANTIIQGTNEPADLVAWLRRPHTKPALLKACNDTLAHNGG